ncbi:TolC family protein [bacterium]|nr:MAG: TolC family protein [bacterium]
MSKYMSVRALLVLILFVAIQNSVAQNSTGVKPELKLSQAIKTALANATEIKQAVYQIEDAEQSVLVSWGEVFPKIDTDISYQRNLEVPVNFLPAEIFGGPAGTLIPVRFGTDNNWSGGFTVSQTLFRGEAFVGIATADLYRLAQKENHRAIAQKVVTQTRVAYYQALFANETYRLEQLNIERLRKNLVENEARVKAGLVDDYDVLRLKVQLKNQEPALKNAENAVLEANRRLNLAMGLPVNVRFEIVGDLKEFEILSENAVSSLNTDLKSIDKMTPLTFDSPNEISFMVNASRGDLRSLKVASDLQDQRIFADKTNFLPNLNASYSMRWTAAQAGTPVFFATSDQRARSQVLGLTLNWNLFNGLKQYTALQQSKIEKKNIEEQRRFAKESAVNETLTAQDNIQNLFELVPSVKEGLQLAKVGYDRALIRQKNGLGTQLEVTDAELQLRQAEVNYATLVFNYLSAKAQYDMAIGKVPFVAQIVN